MFFVFIKLLLKAYFIITIDCTYTRYKYDIITL